MNRRDILTVLAITALLPVRSNAAVPYGQLLKITSPANLDLRDAPLHLALEMLLAAYGLKVRIEGQDKGVVTLKTTDQPLEQHIDLLKRSAQNPFELRMENGVYTFIDAPERQDPRPWQERFLKALSTSERTKGASRAPQTIQDVPRRVCAVLSAGVEDSQEDVCWAAILETGEPDNSRSARIVRVGDRVASGFPNAPDLRVRSLSTTGVTLATAEGGMRFLVRLSGLNPERPREPVRLPVPLSASKPAVPLLRPNPDARPVPGMRSTPKPKVKPSL